jgi:hypothetical protein
MPGVRTIRACGEERPNPEERIGYTLRERIKVWEKRKTP